MSSFQLGSVYLRTMPSMCAIPTTHTVLPHDGKGIKVCLVAWLGMMMMMIIIIIVIIITIVIIFIITNIIIIITMMIIIIITIIPLYYIIITITIMIIMIMTTMMMTMRTMKSQPVSNEHRHRLKWAHGGA